MPYPGEYQIRLTDEEEEEYLCLKRLHQEYFMTVLERHTACFGASPVTLELMAGNAARDLTGNHKLITKEYLRGIVRAYAIGVEDATRPYIYIPPPGAKETPFERLKTPGVVCAGIFTFSPGGREVVLAVWYQDEFALPIDESVIEQLRGIDYDRFNRHCYNDYCYPAGD